MALRGARSKRKLIESERRFDPHRLWRENLEASDPDSDRQAALLEVGREKGWVSPRGKILDPSADPKERAHGEFNDEIRAAAGRS